MIMKIAVALNVRKKLFITSVVLLLLLVCTFSALYINKIQIYGELKVYVLDNSGSIVGNSECSGVSVFNRKKDFQKLPEYFKTRESWYFKSAEIHLGISDNTDTVKVLIVDKSDNILLDTIIFGTNLVQIKKLNYEYNFFEKTAKIGIFQTYKPRLILFLFLVVLAFFLLYYFNRENLKSIPTIASGASILLMIVFVFQFFVQGKIFIWSGFFLISSIAILLALILNRLIKCERKKKQNVMLVIISTILALLISEAGLRIVSANVSFFEKRFGYYESVQYQNRIEPYFLRPENMEYILKSSEFEFKRKSNSLGLSGDEIKVNKEDREFVIIALGDSFTEGDGTHADSTWLKFLEMKLLDNDSVDFRFINAGICGSDPVYELRLLKDKLLIYKPDLVIVANGYEMTDMITRGGKERFEKMKPAIDKKWWQTLYPVSFICRLMVHNLCGYNDLLLSNSEFAKAEVKAISDLKKNILQFKELAQSNDFELLFVFYPLQNELDDGRYGYNSQLIDYANYSRINNLNLLKYYQEIEKITEANSQKYYWEKDGHHNAAGYNKFANGVLWKLKQMTIVPE